jgi:hypothetical protein
MFKRREVEMINNRRSIKCPECGKDGHETVVADGFDDAPESFTLKRECSGPCRPRYQPMTAKEMHELTRLPLSGWSHTRY